MAIMSQTMAIAGVTMTLRSLFEAAFASEGQASSRGEVLITTLPVDRARSVHHRSQLNLALATVVENAAMRNTVGLGSRGGQATGAPNPQAMDLLYLVTAYGPDDDEVGAQRVLGVALRAVHQQPVLPAVDLDALFPDTGATGTLEQVRVSQAPLSREQIVAWWLACHTPYRLSAALQVTGVSLG
jgi:hypothetical protein